MSLSPRHPQCLCRHMLSAGEMRSWLFSSLGSRIFSYLASVCSSAEAGISILGIEVVSLEEKVINGE